MSKIQYKFGDSKDVPFLEEMLYEAVFWNQPKNKPSLDELFLNPDISKIFKEWDNQKGDFSLIAINEHKQPIGAIWYRFWTKENHSYGFVNEKTPELGIALILEMRGQGIGTELMTKTMKHAKKLAIIKISLSVEPDNPSRKLYEKFGFEKIGVSGTSWTMVASL
jgi:RimJ/RimL family protein N-acetyltransferase